MRIVAASNIELITLVREGRFREDLYPPPQRNSSASCRRCGIGAKMCRSLLAHFLDRYCKENDKTMRQFTPAALKLLMDYDWPGNVRELENVVERAVVLSTTERVDVDLLAREHSQQGNRSRRAVAAFGIFDADGRRAGVTDRCRPSAPFAVSNHGRNRAPHHYGHAGAHRDGTRRKRRNGS